MKRLIKIFLIGSLLSIIYAAPVWGREFDGINYIKAENYEIRKMYSKTSLNIRSGPGTTYKVTGIVGFNKPLKVIDYNKNWAILISKNGYRRGYVNKRYLSNRKLDYLEYDIPEYSGFKSFMDWQAITDTSSPQWRLQQGYAYDGDYGIRMVDGRFCVAIGFYFDPKIGQYFDLILENGTVIPCIISDEKRVNDTDEDNLFTSDNGCCTEFVVDPGSLTSKAAAMGDISYSCDEWQSPVEKVRIYKKNAMED